MDDYDRFMSQFEETPEEKFERFRKRQRERKAAELLDTSTHDRDEARASLRGEDTKP